jgi:hypothetical protein
MSRRRRTREPVEPFRPTWGFLWLVGDTLVLLFDYGDIAELTRDWLRTTRERGYLTGVAETPTGASVTTASGCPWADYGLREYRGRSATEPIARRIAAPLKMGGRKRGRIVRCLSAARSLRVVFAHAAPEDQPAWERLLGGTIPTPAVGTTAVTLPGLMVHGRFVPVGERENKWAAIDTPALFAENPF